VNSDWFYRLNSKAGCNLVFQCLPIASSDCFLPPAIWLCARHPLSAASAVRYDGQTSLCSYSDRQSPGWALVSSLRTRVSPCYAAPVAVWSWLGVWFCLRWARRPAAGTGLRTHLSACIVPSRALGLSRLSPAFQPIGRCATSSAATTVYAASAPSHITVATVRT